MRPFGNIARFYCLLALLDLSIESEIWVFVDIREHREVFNLLVGLSNLKYQV